MLSALECGNSGIWNVEFHIPIPAPEFWNVEYGIFLLRTSHPVPLTMYHVKVHWNVEYGM